MTKWLAVYDRECGWHIVGQAPWSTREVRVENRRSKYGYTYKKQRYQPNVLYGRKPEEQSVFISAHMIIDAESEEAAWQALTSIFPKR